MVIYEGDAVVVQVPVAVVFLRRTCVYSTSTDAT
jgi:hypothetical protein